MWGCIGTHTSCSTTITKHTVCNKGLINIIFGQQLTLCYITMQVHLLQKKQVQEQDPDLHQLPHLFSPMFLMPQGMSLVIMTVLLQ